MQTLPVSGFPLLEPDEVDPEIADLYTAIQREYDLPNVPNSAKALGVSQAGLEIYLQIVQAFHQHISLPQSIVPIILYTIATRRNCNYCSATNELYCRTLGVDDETLEHLVKDLDHVSPERLQVIIRFSVKCAFDPQGLVEADYDRLRDDGISDDEIAQIIFVTALANFNDTLADSFKIDVDPAVKQALGR